MVTVIITLQAGDTGGPVHSAPCARGTAIHEGKWLWATGMIMLPYLESFLKTSKHRPKPNPVIKRTGGRPFWSVVHGRCSQLANMVIDLDLDDCSKFCGDSYES